MVLLLSFPLWITKFWFCWARCCNGIDDNTSLCKCFKFQGDLFYNALPPSLPPPPPPLSLSLSFVAEFLVIIWDSILPSVSVVTKTRISRLQACRQHSVLVIFDAEQTYFQPAIQRLILPIQLRYNAQSKAPLVYTTLQAYLKVKWLNCLQRFNQPRLSNFSMDAFTIPLWVCLERELHLFSSDCAQLEVKATDANAQSSPATSQVFPFLKFSALHAWQITERITFKSINIHEIPAWCHL